MATLKDFMGTHVDTATGISGGAPRQPSSKQSGAGCGCSGAKNQKQEDQFGGAKKKASGSGHTNTGKKVKINGQEYTLFKGPRGGKYIRKNGKFVVV